MTRLLRMDAVLIAAVVAIAGAVALVSASETHSGYPTIAADLEPLRTAFNDDPDNVRAVLLASPT